MIYRKWYSNNNDTMQIPHCIVWLLLEKFMVFLRNSSTNQSWNLGVPYFPIISLYLFLIYISIHKWITWIGFYLDFILKTLQSGFKIIILKLWLFYLYETLNANTCKFKKKNLSLNFFLYIYNLKVLLFKFMFSEFQVDLMKIGEVV